MHITRRNALRLASTAALAGAVAACSTTATTVSSAIQQAARDETLVASGLQALMPSLVTLGVPAATMTKVSADIAKLTADAQQVSAAVAASTTPSTTLVQESATIVSEVAGVLLPALDPAAGAAAIASIQAAVSLMPTILSAFGVAAAGHEAPVYTPAQARLILAAHR